MKHQVKIYEEANQTNYSIKVILYFSDAELEKMSNVFKILNITEGKTLVTIDARPNKLSASIVKDLSDND